ncbi:MULTISPECIES: ribosomal-processing cysteine protease Prp [unclassified Paenibacillus]|uniref:ribosomal-processing cysteine protease Prp n=1 Tax=unclassified Paenibacillus TaxID=185978 RepID=UPI002F416826
MITILVERSAANNRINRFTISGHADYGEHGEDIVCAAVSAVSIGTVNAIEKLAGVELPAQMKDGWLKSSIPLLNDQEAEGKTQLLLESMLTMLTSISESYSKHVSVKERRS